MIHTATSCSSTPMFYKQTTKSRYVHSGIVSVSEPTNKGFAVSSLTALSGMEGHYRSNIKDHNIKSPTDSLAG